MKIEKKYKPELICSPGMRAAIEHPNICKDGNKTVMVATDGRRIVVIPVEADKSELGVVPKKALAFARRERVDKKSHTIEIKLNGKVEFQNGWSMPRGVQLEFPKWEQVIPAMRPPTVCINAKYLYELAQAMGVENVKLHIGESMDPIRVSPADNNGAYGVLMPVRLQ